MNDCKPLLHELESPLSLYEIIDRGLTPEEKELYCVGPNKQRRTKSLFYDFNKDGASVFTLQDCRPNHYKIGINGLIVYDMRQLYLGVDDITEWQFIHKFLYDKHQLDSLLKSYDIRPHLENWRNEQRLKVKSNMFNILLDDASDRYSKTKTQSAKYLLEKYYDPATKNNKQPRKEKEEDKRYLVEDHARILESFGVSNKKEKVN